MEIEIRTLAGVPVSVVADTFNLSFSDYAIPFSYTEDTMKAKIKAEAIHLNYSIGAFYNDEMVGLMLHGYDIIDGKPTIWNGGTGVVPAARGKAVSLKMYEFAINHLANAGVYTHLLEVLDDNAPAIRTYEKAGFKKIRTLGAYRSAKDRSWNNEVETIKLDDIPQEVASFETITPAWQNMLIAIKRDMDTYELTGVYEGDELVAFAAWQPATARLRYFAVKPGKRRNGIGTALLSSLLHRLGEKQMVITNLDDADVAATSFLAKMGFEKFLGLYEMKLEVNKAAG